YSNIYQKPQNDIEIEEIGILTGEKLYEELFSIEEAKRTFEMDEMYNVIPQLNDLVDLINFSKYKNVKKFDETLPFNSAEGPFLSKKEIKDFLIKKKII
ncbi:MAG: polysaccharide biosynthesis protein, partial [Candidatus Lokiarchaeota archaeon]|nr:polysaccharide biosynthesis protein [Candidatus Lokiarchaeota archaeon]